MRKTLLNLCVVTLLSVVSTSAWALSQVNGVYQIGSAADLKAFADLVNSGTTGASAVLTADIDYTAYTTGFIGTNGSRYSGTFDGQGHTITTNIKTTVQGTGLFGSISGATIKNLVLDGSIESSQKWIGGIGGIARGDATNIQNIIVKSTVKFTGGAVDSTCGGLFGDMEGAFTVKNCAFLGTINVGSGTNVGGLVSWTGSGKFYNCLVAPVEIIAGSQKDFVSGGAASTSNCYKVANNDAKLASGQLCHQLNGSKSGGTDWYQTLGTNGYPVPFNTSKKIYKNLSTYVNVDNPVQVGSASDLANFAAIVNDGGTDLNAVLTSDIDYRSYTGVANMIGDNNNTRYAGTFDGQGHTVTVAFNTTSVQETGLFRRINGATIQNLKVAGTITASDKFAGGIAARIEGTGTIRNCESAVTINDSGSGDATHGGVIAVASASGTSCIENCLFSGHINAASRNGCSGIVGWGTSSAAVKNCLVVGDITLTGTDNDIVSRGSTTGDGNYYCGTYSSLNNRLSATSASATQKTSGELCYLLNGSTDDGTTWKQTIGTDANPLPFGASQTVHQASPSGYTNLTVSEGKTQIANGATLKKFATEVNAGNTNVDAVLTDNINLNEIAWTPIGNGSYQYSGTFDGAGKAITNFSYTSTGDYNGLFGFIDGATIKDFSISGTLTSTHAENGVIGWTNGAAVVSGIRSSLNITVDCGTHTGGIVGGSQALNQSTLLIENCLYDGTLTSNNHADAQGGIIGYTYVGTIRNCLFNGTINGNVASQYGGILGYARVEWFGGIHNCLSIGKINASSSTLAAAIIGNWNGPATSNVTNNYYLLADGSTTSIAIGNKADMISEAPVLATTENLASGEVAYKLNGSTCYEPNWFQNLTGTADANPVLSNTHGIVNMISSVGYTTQYIPSTDVTIPEGVEAYAGEINGEWLRLVPIEDEISKEDAVVLKGTANTYYSFIPTTGVTPAESNSLLGSDGNVKGGTNIYALAKKNDVVGFYLVSSEVTIPAGKAYLNTSAGVKGFTFLFDDDDATGINSPLLTSPEEEGQVYNLAGQRVSKLQKGINIINGKKVLK